MINIEQALLGGLKAAVSFSFGLGKQKKLLVLIYHRVLDRPDPMRSYEIDRSTFEWHMALMARYFNVLPLADALTSLQNDRLPSRAACITFDDGYADNYHNALPILLNHNLPATFFIASGYLDGGLMWNDCVIEAIRLNTAEQIDLTPIGLSIMPIVTDQQKYQAAMSVIRAIKHLDPLERQQKVAYIAATAGQALPDSLMMTSTQLKALFNSGMEIGGHTVSHPILAKTEHDCALHEIIENKVQLEKILDTTIRFFAYPNGKPGIDFLPQQVELVKQAGYQAALSTQWGIVDKRSDRFQLPRFTPWDDTPVKFALRVLRLQSH